MIDRKQFLDVFKHHVEQINTKYPKCLNDIETQIAWEYNIGCPFLFTDPKVDISLEWIVSGTEHYSNTWNKQTIYFQKYRDDIELQYQMIQIYCEVVYW